MGFYVVSAWFYGEVYIWSRPAADRLGFTDQGKNYERIRLNERPFFLRFMFVVLAFVQTCVHLWRDFDKIQIPIMKPNTDPANATVNTSPDLRKALIQRSVNMFKWASGTVSLTIVFGSILYFFGFRHFLWEYYYYFASYLVSLSRTRTSPVGLPPFFSLLLQCVIEGFLLSLLWQVTNQTFNLYMERPPVKKGKPITDDSKDPNGSLLNGMKSKKATTKAVAFLELAMITDQFSERRKTLFGDLERRKGTTSQQITEICLAEIRLLIERINCALDPKFRPASEAIKESNTQAIALVPRIATQPLKTTPIKGPGDPLVTRTDKIGAFVADIAKSHSSPENGSTAYGRKAIKNAQEKAEEAVNATEVKVSGLFANFVSSPLGAPFRNSLRRTASLVVTGAPYSRISLICNAVTALTNLTISSLTEDDYGKWQKGVPDIVRVFTIALTKIDEYVAELEVHWSDIETLKKSPEEQKKGLKEVDKVRECLRSGLEMIMRRYGEYLSGLGVSSLERQEAKKIASRGPEMAVVR